MTPKVSQETIIRLYDAVGLSEEESEYLVKKGYRSAISVLTGHSNDRLYKLEGEDLPEGCVQLLVRLAQYLQWKQETEGNLSNLTADAEFFETFIPEKVLNKPAHNQQAANSPAGNATTKMTSSNVSIRLSDYPRFSGRQQDWTKFNERFKAVIGLAGLKELLKDQPDHEERLNKDKDDASKNVLLHAILMHCTSDGLALHQVKKFESTADGHSAYRRLYEYYQGRGNKQQYSNALLTSIMSLSLTSNSHGGMDTYLNKFEEKAQELAFHGDPLSEAQKTTMLLNGVKDRQYTALKTMCRSQNFDYEKTVLELRREAQEFSTTSDTPKRSIKTTKTSRGDSSKSHTRVKETSKVPNDYRLPPNVWKTLTRKQQELYKKALKTDGRSSADFVEEPSVKEKTAPRKMQNAKTSAFDSVDHLDKKKQDKIGEEAGDIWKPKPRSVSVKKAHKRYDNKNSAKVKSSHKEPDNPVIEGNLKWSLPKRDFSEFSEQEIAVQAKIPKKPKSAKPMSLVDYIKKSTPNFSEQPVKCTKHSHKVHNHVSILNPPKWTLKPVLADEFCLYSEDQDLHIAHVTIYDPDIHCIFNLTVDQALELYPEVMENYSLFSQNTKKIYKKSISLHSSNAHNDILIVDSGADTSGIGGTEWIIDEVTE